MEHTIETLSQELLDKHGNSIVALVSVGEQRRVFSMHIPGQVTQESIVRAFKYAGETLARDFTGVSACDSCICEFATCAPCQKIFAIDVDPSLSDEKADCVVSCAGYIAKEASDAT